MRQYFRGLTHAKIGDGISEAAFQSDDLAVALTSEPLKKATKQLEEMKKVGASGTTVLVGEAVLSKNVPDITDQIRRAVFARVPLPAAAPNTPAGPAVGAMLPQASGNVAPAAPGAAVPTASPFGPAPVSPVEATVTQSAPGGVDGSGN